MGEEELPGEAAEVEEEEGPQGEEGEEERVQVRVLGILCMGHVFNFAILGIPSSTIRNHP